MTSRLSLDKISLSNDNTRSITSPVKSESADLSLFLATNKSSFINNSSSLTFLHTQSKSYIAKSSSLLNNKYFNSSVSLNNLSENSNVSAAYTNAISENLSLANQTR